MSHVESGARAGLPASRPESVRIGRQRYVRAPTPVHFPSEEPWEEHVGETQRHLEARTTLYLLLKRALADHAIGSEQFVYWDAADPRKCLSPDVFVKRGSAGAPFDTWKVWERGAPDLAVEIVSASDHRDHDWDAKMERYRASGIGEVVRFDPTDGIRPVRIWDRVEGDLVERAPDSGDLRECAALGLWWVVVPSPFGPQLRLAQDPEGAVLLPTSEEAEQREAEARQREAEARAAAERERDAALAELAALRAQNAARSKKGI